MNENAMMKMMGRGKAKAAMSMPAKKAAAKKAPAKKMAMGGKAYAAGGLTAGHKAADGCAIKGKTKGTEIKMAKGGKAC
jgi:hypothetical protein